MLEENKALIRDFLMKSNKEGRTIVEFCVPNFTAHIGASPTMNLQEFQKFQTNYYAQLLRKSDHVGRYDCRRRQGGVPWGCEGCAYRGVQRNLGQREISSRARHWDGKDS